MKKHLISTTLVSLIGLFSLSAHAQTVKMTEEQKVFYALGHNIAANTSVFAMSASELELVKQGLTDGVKKTKPIVDLAIYNQKIKGLADQRSAALSTKQNTIGKSFIDKAAKEKGAVKTPSGLVFMSLKEGTGAFPAATDTVKVHYRGTLIDGTEFDSSYSRNEPAEFPLNGVIKCWTEGVQKMKVGGKSRLICPSNLAYGNQAMGKIVSGSTLNFEIELLSIKKATEKSATEKSVPK
jgi:FKBP-type peptidyl-prolyl cis-trans isomerase FkpA